MHESVEKTSLPYELKNYVRFSKRAVNVTFCSKYVLFETSTRQLNLSTRNSRQLWTQISSLPRRDLSTPELKTERRKTDNERRRSLVRSPLSLTQISKTGKKRLRSVFCYLKKRLVAETENLWRRNGLKHRYSRCWWAFSEAGRMYR